MKKLPRLTGKSVKKALLKAGFKLVRVKGSHNFLVHHEDPTRWATIPVHSGEILPLKILNNILKSTKLSLEDFKKLL